MSEQRRRQQQGQVLVMSAAVMAFLFVPLCVFVIDTGLVAASYAQLGETLQAAAEDGASSIDQNAYRSSNGQQVALDPAGAQQTADRRSGVVSSAAAQRQKVGMAELIDDASHSAADVQMLAQLAF